MLCHPKQMPTCHPQAVGLALLASGPPVWCGLTFPFPSTGASYASRDRGRPGGNPVLCPVATACDCHVSIREPLVCTCCVLGGTLDGPLTSTSSLSLMSEYVPLKCLQKTPEMAQEQIQKNLIQNICTGRLEGGNGRLGKMPQGGIF